MQWENTDLAIQKAANPRKTVGQHRSVQVVWYEYHKGSRHYPWVQRIFRQFWLFPRDLDLCNVLWWLAVKWLVMCIFTHQVSVRYSKHGASSLQSCVVGHSSAILWWTVGQAGLRETCPRLRQGKVIDPSTLPPQFHSKQKHLSNLLQPCC